jgi:hypothetical protein
MDCSRAAQERFTDIYCLVVFLSSTNLFRERCIEKSTVMSGNRNIFRHTTERSVHWMWENLKRCFPIKLKDLLKIALMDYQLHRAIQKIRALPAGQVPPRQILISLRAGWGNEGFSAQVDYLEEVARKATTTVGPILECGSGLTTILAGLLAGKRGISVWSLEDSREWYMRVTSIVRRYHIPGVHVLFCPLRNYPGFSWYDLSLEELPENFSFVICDGPIGTVPGGRYGLLPVLGPRLTFGTIILLDDVERTEETEVLCRWVSEAQVTVSIHRESTGTFALVGVNPPTVNNINR